MNAVKAYLILLYVRSKTAKQLLANNTRDPLVVVPEPYTLPISAVKSSSVSPLNHHFVLNRHSIDRYPDLRTIQEGRIVMASDTLEV